MSSFVNVSAFPKKVYAWEFQELVQVNRHNCKMIIVLLKAALFNWMGLIREYKQPFYILILLK